MNPRDGVGFHIRRMTDSDLVAGLALSLAAKWPHRLEDWRELFELGQGLVAETANGVIGSLMVWNAEPEVTLIGMGLAAPDVDADAVIGTMIAQVIRDQPAERHILTGTQEFAGLFDSLGFTVAQTIRKHQGAVLGVPLQPLPAGQRIRPVSAGDAETIDRLATAATGIERGPLLASLLRDAQGVAIDLDGEAIGFALFRRFGHGFLIGPVFAPNADAARALIAHWLGANPGMFIRLDVPAESGLSDWLEGLGMPCESVVWRMVRGRPLQIDAPETSVAIASQALG